VDEDVGLGVPGHQKLELALQHVEGRLVRETRADLHSIDLDGETEPMDEAQGGPRHGPRRRLPPRGTALSDRREQAVVVDVDLHHDAVGRALQGARSSRCASHP